MGQILLAGIDTLAVGWDASEFHLTPEEWQYLADAKLNAQSSTWKTDGVPVRLRGQEFAMMPKGTRGYEYVLVNADITLQLAARAVKGGAPEVHVTWRSQYLWRYGWQAVYWRVRQWVEGWANINYVNDKGEVVLGEKVSRADMCADLNHGIPDVDLKAGEVVTYAKSRNEFYIQHHLKGLDETGYTFGKGDVMCRVYDKEAEIKVSDKQWFEDLWRKHGWDGESPVTRVEFQMRRDFLRSFQVETAADLERCMGDLWAYLSGWELDKGWLSLRDVNPDDSNHRRWEVKPFWQVVMYARAKFGDMTGIFRIAQRRPKEDILKKAARGILVSMGALHHATHKDEYQGRGGLSVDESIFLSVKEFVRELVVDKDFQDGVETRAAKFAFMT